MREKSVKLCAILLTFALTVIVFAACSSKAPGSPPAPSSTTATESSKTIQPKINYPTKPIQLISPSSAGGDLDYDNRLFAQFLSKELKVNVVVSNVSGAGTVTGMKQVLAAEPDGYTIVGNNCEGFFPKLIDNTDVGVESFKLAGIYATDSTTVLVARSGMEGVKDLPSFVEYAKKNPGKIEYGIATGSSNHMLGFAFDSSFDIKSKFVDVGNNSEKLTALLGKQVDYCTLTYQLIKDYVESGDVIVLGLLDTERNPYFPDVPILSDYGYKNVSYVKPMWIGMPLNTSDEIVATFSAAMKKVVENPDYIAQCKKVSLNPVFYGPKEAYDLIDSIRSSSFAPFAEDMKAALKK